MNIFKEKHSLTFATNFQTYLIHRLLFTFVHYDQIRYFHCHLLVLLLIYSLKVRFVLTERNCGTVESMHLGVAITLELPVQYVILKDLKLNILLSNH